MTETIQDLAKAWAVKGPFRCTNCGSPISHVHIFVTEENRYELELDDDWVHWYGQESVDDTEKSADAECPECGEKIGEPWDGVEDISSWALKLLNSILIKEDD